MKTLVKVHKSADEYLKDKNLSLRAKGFLTMVLTNNITTFLYKNKRKHCNQFANSGLWFDQFKI